MTRISKNGDHVADRHQFFDASRIPIGGTDTAMAGGAPDGLRIICAMNANVRFVQTGP